MYVAITTLDVIPDKRDKFLAAIRKNALASLRNEEGCLLFDVISVEDDLSRFILYEVYRDRESFLVGHRATPHYKEWRAVALEVLRQNGQTALFGDLVAGRDDG